MKVMRDFCDMAAFLAGRGKRCRVAVVCPNDESTADAVCQALEQDLVTAVLVGCNEDRKARFASYGNQVEWVDAADADDAARKGVALVKQGLTDVLMKGLLNTDNLLHAVLNKQEGILPSGQVLTHLTCAQIPGHDRLLLFTDAAVIPHPTREQRQAQLRYVLAACTQLGIERPRVALINCSEKVNEKAFPFTLEYRELVEQAQKGCYGDCIVDGPLDMKTSLSPQALHKKGIASPLEGLADAVIFPDIQAGNVFYKTITLFCQAQTAGILCGTQVPVVLPSRGDSADSKFYSLVLAALL